MEPEPGIWVPVPQTQFVGQASCTNHVFLVSMDQVVLEPEPEGLYAWSWSPKLEFRFHRLQQNTQLELC